MLLGIGFKVILIATVLLGVMVPIRARLLDGRSTPPKFRDGPFSTHPIVGLIRPLAQFLDVAVIEARATTAERRTSNSAAAAVLAAPLSAFAVIPFGLRYTLGGHDVKLVVANLEWGVVWLLGAAMLSIYGSMGLAAGVGKPVLSSVVKISYAAGAGLSLAALAMVFDSLNLTAIAVAQDRFFPIGELFGPALIELQGLQLPRWGIILQPMSLLLYTVCALGMFQLTAGETPDEPGRRLSGAQYLLIRISENLGNLSVAGVLVALFLGGGAVPYISGPAIVDAIATYFGTGFATLLCMAIHTLVFFAKVLIVVVALEPLRRRLINLSLESSLNLCWKVMVPLSLLNVFVTAHFLLAPGTP